MPWKPRISPSFTALALVCALSLCLGKETKAEDDVFQEEVPRPVRANGFVSLEDANSDLAPGQNEAPATEAAPIDLIAAEAPEPAHAAPAAASGEGEDERMTPDEDAVAKIEEEGEIQKITLKNGDVILNVRQGADFEKTLSKVLGAEAGDAEAPIQPTQDWAVFPTATR